MLSLIYTQGMKLVDHINDRCLFLASTDYKEKSNSVAKVVYIMVYMKLTLKYGYFSKENDVLYILHVPLLVGK